METLAIKKYTGIPRRKIDRLAKECKKLSLSQAKVRLAFLPQVAARELWQTIWSAGNNYLYRNPNANIDELIIKNIIVDVAPSMKRSLPRARGKADRIVKRSCHVKVIVEDKSSKPEGQPKQEKKKELANKKAENRKAENKQTAKSTDKKTNDKKSNDKKSNDKKSNDKKSNDIDKRANKG